MKNHVTVSKAVTALNAFVLVLAFGFEVAEAAVAQPAGVDWSQAATEELAKSRAGQGAAASAASATAENALPTPATIRAEVTGVRSTIERSALRFTFLFEPYRPKGIGAFGAGQPLDYGALPDSVLGQVDLRWLPFDLGNLGKYPLSLGGFGAFGYSRQALPIVAASGFRYEDAALNSIRVEAGFAMGLELNERWNLEARAGLGRLSFVQTSKYADLAGTFERSYMVGALDLSYRVFSRFALVASAASRSPLGAGSGSIIFDPLTLSGGFLVQVR